MITKIANRSTGAVYYWDEVAHKFKHEHYDDSVGLVGIKWVDWDGGSSPIPENFSILEGTWVNPKFYEQTKHEYWMEQHAKESANYSHVAEMSYEEKVAMYMDVNKDVLVKMLIECNRCLEARGPQFLNEQGESVTNIIVNSAPPKPEVIYDKEGEEYRVIEKTKNDENPLYKHTKMIPSHKTIGWNRAMKNRFTVEPPSYDDIAKKHGYEYASMVSDNNKRMPLYKVSDLSPVQTIHDLTDEQITTIAELAADYPLFKSVHITRKPKEISVSFLFDDGDGVGVYIPETLGVYTEEGWGYYNQHKIHKLFIEWNVLPINSKD